MGPNPRAVAHTARKHSKRMLNRFDAGYAELEARAQDTADEKYGGGSLVQRAANAGTVISVVVIGVVALVGLLIFGEVYEAMPEMPEEMEGTGEDIVVGFGDALGLVPIILIVLLASVVIGVVQRMRGM